MARHFYALLICVPLLLSVGCSKDKQPVNHVEDAAAPPSSTQVASASNLCAIGDACLMYASEYDDKYPPNLEELVKEARLSPEELESPRKPKNFNGPSYIYIAKQTTSMEPANIIAYENPEFCDGKINVLFLDLRVAVMNPQDFLSNLEATYERLGKRMPEIKF